MCALCCVNAPKITTTAITTLSFCICKRMRMCLSVYWKAKVNQSQYSKFANKLHIIYVYIYTHTRTNRCLLPINFICKFPLLLNSARWRSKGRVKFAWIREIVFNCSGFLQLFLFFFYYQIIIYSSKLREVLTLAALANRENPQKR